MSLRGWEPQQPEGVDTDPSFDGARWWIIFFFLQAHIIGGTSHSETMSASEVYLRGV